MEAVPCLQDFENHQHERGGADRAQRPRQQGEAAGNTAIPQRKRSGHDIRIGELEQAKAGALHDQPRDPQGGRGLLGPRA